MSNKLWVVLKLHFWLLFHDNTFSLHITLLRFVLLSSYVLQVDQAVLGDLMKLYLPTLHTHMSVHNVEISLITLNWFLTLYSAVLAPRILLR